MTPETKGQGMRQLPKAPPPDKTLSLYRILRLGSMPPPDILTLRTSLPGSEADDE